MATSRLCPSRRIPRDHTSRECHRRGPAELGERLFVSIGEDDVPDGAIRQRAVVQGFSWRQLAVDQWTCLRELRPDAQAADGPERCLQHEVPEVVYCCCRNCIGCIAATVWRHRPRRPHGQDDAAARCFRGASLPTVLLSHVPHEAVIRRGNEPHCAHRRYSLGGCFGRGCLLQFPMRALPVVRRSRWQSRNSAGELDPLVTESWLLGTESPASLIRL